LGRVEREVYLRVREGQSTRSRQVG
jgi:hypothetical protein